MTTLEITNPADGSRLAEVPADDAASVAAKAARARAAQPAWAALPLAERVAAIARFRAAVAAGIETLARTLTQEVGKPLAQSRNELNGFLGRIGRRREHVCRFQAGYAFRAASMKVGLTRSAIASGLMPVISRNQTFSPRAQPAASIEAS